MGLAPIAMAVAGLSVGHLISQSSKKVPEPTPMPEPPKIEEAQDQAQQKAKVKKIQAARQRTTYTSPLGIAGQANIAKKTLLGQ